MLSARPRARPRGPPAARPCRRSPIPPSCRSASAGTTSPRRSATTRSSIVAGETGSGKTTQLPKICLELGRGVARHDRPHPAAADRRAHRRRADRRGAAAPRSATRSATRSASPTRSASDTLVKLMTDGILLAEIQRDRLLRRYDTIIIDEAHERSLNIDFLLGYLKQLLPRRPDLKVIITSATIDPERFAAHFGRRAGRSRSPAAPTRSRSATGRSVDPDDDEAERPRPGRRRSCDAVDELAAEGPRRRPRLPLRRARDPRHRRRAARRAALPRHRDPAAVRAAVGRRAAPGLRSRTPAGGSCWPPTSPRPR